MGKKIVWYISNKSEKRGQQQIRYKERKKERKKEDEIAWEKRSLLH
jgi:hypothetical protein